MCPSLPLLSSIRLTSLPTLTRREGKNNPQGSYKDLLNPLISPSNYVFQLLYVFRFVWPPVASLTHSLQRCCSFSSGNTVYVYVHQLFSCCAPFVDGGERDVSDIWINAHPSRYSDWPMTECPFLVAGCLVLLPSCQGIHFLQKERYRRSTNDDVMTPFSPLPDAAGSFRNNRHDFEWRIISQVIRKMKRNRNAFPSDPRRRFERVRVTDCTAESFVSLVCFSHATSPCWFIPVVQREEWIKNSSCCPFFPLFFFFLFPV